MTTKFIFEAELFDSYVPYPRFEGIPLFDQPEEVDLFLGGLVRSVARVAKDVGRTAQRAAKLSGETRPKYILASCPCLRSPTSRPVALAFLGGKASAPAHAALTMDRPK